MCERCKPSKSIYQELKQSDKVAKSTSSWKLYSTVLSTVLSYFPVQKSTFLSWEISFILGRPCVHCFSVFSFITVTEQTSCSVFNKTSISVISASMLETTCLHVSASGSCLGVLWLFPQTEITTFVGDYFEQRINCILWQQDGDWVSTGHLVQFSLTAVDVFYWFLLELWDISGCNHSSG